MGEFATSSTGPRTGSHRCRSGVHDRRRPSETCARRRTPVIGPCPVPCRRPWEVMSMNVRSIWVSMVCVLLGCAPGRSWSPQDGDIIFHTSRSAQSEAVGRATGSRWTHMGIVFLRNDKPFVLEAVGPVKMTPLTEWVARGAAKRYVVKRLADPSVLRQGGASRLRAAANRYLGKPYDFYFEWSNDRIYCSELVWK